MNYRHTFHAGNFGDVHKHVALVCVLLHLRKKEKPFVVIDTHAGRGSYDLSGPEAQRTGESATGIDAIRGLRPKSDALKTYLEIVRGFGENMHPGSPLIAVKLLRSKDRLIAIEKHADEFAALARLLNAYPRASAVEADGYARLSALLPPPERRGAILIDPPYEAGDEFETLAHAFAAAYRRFATGIFLLWFPMKLQAQVEALAGELRNAGATKLLQCTIDVGQLADEGRLSAAGLLVANPPFGFDAEMRTASNEILPFLQQGAGANATTDWLSESR